MWLEGIPKGNNTISKIQDKTKNPGKMKTMSYLTGKFLFAHLWKPSAQNNIYPQ